MMVPVPLSEAVAERARVRASLVGQDVAAFVEEAVEEKLARSVEDADDKIRDMEKWMGELKAWIASHEATHHFVDDSRESIYAGRGE